LFKILKKQDLGNRVYLLEATAPRIAKVCKAGQFFIIRQGEGYERIPLTIADSDAEKGTITMVFQAIGASTTALSKLEVGDEVADIVGPLGKPSEVENYGRCVVVGGGVGVAPCYPIVKALKAAGNHVTAVIGARTKDLLLWEERFREASDELLVATDDGSYMHKGFVTELLEEKIKKNECDICWVIGPMPMMRAACNMTRNYGTKTIVSMNPIMVDGTGMCGACRVCVNGETKFACVDGPEFDGHKVDFDLAMKRSKMFKEDEAIALEKFNERFNGGVACK